MNTLPSWADHWPEYPHNRSGKNLGLPSVATNTPEKKAQAAVNAILSPAPPRRMCQFPLCECDPNCGLPRW